MYSFCQVLSDGCWYLLLIADDYARDVEHGQIQSMALLQHSYVQKKNDVESTRKTIDLTI